MLGALLAHPLRPHILTRLSLRPHNPAELAADFKKDTGSVHYHIHQLQAVGLVQLIKKEAKNPRGQARTYYGAKPLHIPDDEWMTVPSILRTALTDAGLRELAAPAHIAPTHERTLPLDTAPAEALALIRDELAGHLGAVARSLLDVVHRTEAITGRSEVA
jgi:hypothetical protein